MVDTTLPGQPETELPVTLKPEKPFVIDDKPVPVPCLVNPNPASLPAKVNASSWWVGAKHFLYGAIIAGSAALAAGSAWPVALALAISAGSIEAARKVSKDKAVANGSSWADVLDKLLAVVLELVKAWRERKSNTKEVQK